MNPYKVELFFWQLSRILLTPLLIVSLRLFYSVFCMTTNTALRTYHAVPYMLEHILCGMMLYLVFSLAITKIHLASLHDGGDSCLK